MSSSQQPSNNNNNNPAYQNQLLDYENDESLNSQRQAGQASYLMNGISLDDMRQSYENDLFEEMYPFQEDVDEDLPSEIVNELEARNPMQSNVNNDDEAVFSDDVQNAFKKYQNEYSKYWAHNDTTWNNSFLDEELFDDEQEELYAQMEECWNYMTHEDTPADMPSKNLVEQSQQSQLNPDASEFKPTWLKSSSTTMNKEPFVTLTPSQPKEQ